MTKGQILVGLDIGTTKICTVVAESRAEELTITGVGVSQSRGLRKGVVIDIEKTVHAIEDSVEKAEQMAGVQIASVLVGVAGAHISSLNSSGIVAVSGSEGEVSPSDVERVLEAARAVSVPSDRAVLHVLPREFVIDHCGGIKEPVGMTGMRLEAKVHIITGSFTSLQNITKCVRRIGLNIEQVVLQPLASSEAVLTPEEKELGVVLLDIGGGTTDIAVFIEDSIAHTAVLPVGGSHITHDVAVGLRTSVPEAERIKIHHGTALIEGTNDEEFFTVPGVAGRDEQAVSQRYLAAIIQPRVQEIFELVKKEIDSSGYTELLAGGVVLTGGTSLLPGITKAASRYLGLPSRLGSPSGVRGLSDAVDSPAFATGVGLVRYGYEGAGRISSMGQRAQRRKLFSSLITRVGDWLQELI